MKDLVISIEAFDGYLKSLALVSMKMNFPLDSIASLVKNSHSLQELDLSGNDFQPKHFAPLLKAIAYNKVLRTINLSWNKIIGK